MPASLEFIYGQGVFSSKANWLVYPFPADLGPYGTALSIFEKELSVHYPRTYDHLLASWIEMEEAVPFFNYGYTDSDGSVPLGLALLPFTAEKIKKALGTLFVAPVTMALPAWLLPFTKEETHALIQETYCSTRKNDYGKLLVYGVTDEPHYRGIDVPLPNDCPIAEVEDPVWSFISIPNPFTPPPVLPPPAPPPKPPKPPKIRTKAFQKPWPHAYPPKKGSRPSAPPPRKRSTRR